MAAPGFELTGTARRTPEEIEPVDRERTTEKFRSIVDFPAHYLEGLQGVPGYVLRVGDFRVITDWDRETDVLYVVAILEREHDYRELGQLGEVWGAWRE